MDRRIRACGISVRSRATGRTLHHSTISRFIKSSRSHAYSPSFDGLLEILDAVQVDRVASFLSAEVLEDPDKIDHPGVCLLAAIIPQLVRDLTGPKSKIMSDFTDSEIRVGIGRLFEIFNRLGEAKLNQQIRFEEWVTRR